MFLKFSFMRIINVYSERQSTNKDSRGSEDQIGSTRENMHCLLFRPHGAPDIIIIFAEETNNLDIIALSEGDISGLVLRRKGASDDTGSRLALISVAIKVTVEVITTRCAANVFSSPSLLINDSVSSDESGHIIIVRPEVITESKSRRLN